MPYLVTRSVEGVPVYWTGRTHYSGYPDKTLWKCDAKHFSTQRAAYEAASLYPNLAEWRVVKR